MIAAIISADVIPPGMLGNRPSAMPVNEISAMNTMMKKQATTKAISSLQRVSNPRYPFQIRNPPIRMP